MQLEVWVDSDFAGCKRTRKSTSGGVLCIGPNPIKHWSRTQGILALSTAEAEYYAMVKGASQALGVQAMLTDLGIDSPITECVDATAAKAISMRRGLGKVRHLDVHQLWIQARTADGTISLRKVPTPEN